jgi:hypothetical protein
VDLGAAVAVPGAGGAGTGGRFEIESSWPTRKHREGPMVWSSLLMMAQTGSRPTASGDGMAKPKKHSFTAARRSIPLFGGKTAKGNYSKAKKASNGMPRPMFAGRPMRPGR